MTLQKKCGALVQAIHEAFEECAPLGDDARRFIDSTFSNPSLEELGEILRDEENCEKEPLLDLIFSPDRTFQERLEDLLEKDAPGKKEEAETLRMLMADPPRAFIRFDDGEAPLILAMPPETAASFLARLNIRRTLNGRLIRAVGKWPGENWRRAVKVRLRNSRFSMTENLIAFLCTFFDRISPDREEFFERLDFLLGILGEADDDADIYDFLVEKKRTFFRDLQRSARTNELLAKSNMETLMVMGVRSPYIHEADARDGIRWIDDICLAVFDRVDPLPFPVRENVNLGEIIRGEELDKVINLLS